MARKIRKGRNEAVVFEKEPEQNVIETQEAPPEASPSGLDDAVITSDPPKKRGRPRKNAAPVPEMAPAAEPAQDATAAPAVEQPAEPAQDPVTAPIAPHGPTLGDLCEAWPKHLETIGKSRGTVFGYSIDLGIATKHFGGDTSIAALTPSAVQAYFESPGVTTTKAGRAKAKPTIDKTRRAFRLALTWAKETGLLSSTPLPE